MRHSAPTLTNQSTRGGPYTIKAAGSAGLGISLEASAVDGTRFVTIGGGTLAAGVGETLVVEFEAVNAGTSGNIAPGEIFKIHGGALPGVDISNPAESQTRVARDGETNVEYVTRALARWGSLGAGGHNGAVTFRILSGVETLTKLGVADDNPNGQSSGGTRYAAVHDLGHRGRVHKVGGRASDRGHAGLLRRHGVVRGQTGGRGFIQECPDLGIERHGDSSCGHPLWRCPRQLPGL